MPTRTMLSAKAPFVDGARLVMRDWYTFLQDFFTKGTVAIGQAQELEEGGAAFDAGAATGVATGAVQAARQNDLEVLLAFTR